MSRLITLIPLFLILGLFEGICYWLGEKYSGKKWVVRLTGPYLTFILLIAVTIFGFYTNLDYTLSSGCIQFTEYPFDETNLKYSGIALLLLCIGFFSPSKDLAKYSLTIELLYWLYKLFFIKGGYAVGYGAVPSFDVLAFDIIALTLRLLFIKKVLELPFRTIFIFIIAFIIMTLKVMYFR